MSKRRQAAAAEMQKWERFFAGMETVGEEREAARAIAEGEALTGMMRQPKADVSKAAGEIERNAPLFFGTGANPGLFS